MSKAIFLTAALVMIGFTTQAMEHRICAQVMTKMYNEETKEVKMANNSCVAKDLQVLGFMAVPMDFNAEIAEHNSSKLTLITDGKYKLTRKVYGCDASRICPQMPRPYTEIALSLPLIGCVDSAHVTYKISENQEGITQVLVSALNVENKRSKNVRCFTQAHAQKTIIVDGDQSKIQIEFVQNVAK